MIPEKITFEELDKMSQKELMELVKKFSERYRVDDRKKFRLKDFPTKDSSGLNTDKKVPKELLIKGVQIIAGMQDKMYAQDKWALLVIFQGMDASGKDGAIKHVMSGLNPQGCQVTSFKAPSQEELDHDFLWRCMKKLPERGCIGIFNRSYYEEVLIVRVHEEILQTQKIPEKLVTKNIWDERYRDIRHFEEYLSHNGIVIVKCFLHLSAKEQNKRFLERLDDPDKNWKFNAADAKERDHWKEYWDAYEQMILNTSREAAPWYVVPADDKPTARIIIASAIIRALDSMNLEYPAVSKSKLLELRKIKKEFLAE
jgi:PPK2 family polyphosphate:nucleotide phosphotransferase